MGWKIRPYWSLRIKTALKIAFSLCLLVLVIAIWNVVVPGFEDVQNTWIVFSALFCCIMMNSYHSMGLVKNIVDMTLAVFLASALGLITFVIVDTDIWSGLPILFVVSFIVTLGDRFIAHPLLVKIFAMEYIALVFFTPMDLKSKMTAAIHMITISQILPSITTLFIACIIWPTFPSTLVKDEVAETLEDFKSYFQSIEAHISLIAKRSMESTENEKRKSSGSYSSSELETSEDDLVDRRPTPQEIDSAQKISSLEKKLNSHILRLRTYINDSAKETWNKNQNRKGLCRGHKEFLLVIERCVQKLISTRIAVTKGGFIKRVGSDLLAPILPLFKTLENEIRTFLDSMIDTLNNPHNSVDFMSSEHIGDIHSPEPGFSTSAFITHVTLPANNATPFSLNNSNSIPFSRSSIHLNVNSEIPPPTTENNNSNNSNSNSNNNNNENNNITLVSNANSSNNNSNSSNNPDHSLSFFPKFVPPARSSLSNITSLSHNVTTAHDSSSRLFFSVDPLDAICRNIEQAYTKAISDYEISHKPINPSAEITRLSMFMFCSTQFAGELHSLGKIVKNYQHATFWGLYKYVLLANFVVFIASVKSIYLEFDYGIIKVLQERGNIRAELKKFVKSTRWHFPLRMALSLTSALAFILWLVDDNRVLLVNGVWACTTIALVLLPSLGATVTRGSLRILGTITGAILGYCVVWIVTKSGPPGEFWRVFSTEIFTFLVIFMFGLLQQIPNFAYSGTVGALTYQVMVFLEFDSTHPGISIEVSRVAHILAGVLWALIISSIVFPYRAANSLGLNFLDSISTSGKVFSSILHFGILTEHAECGLEPAIRNEIEETLATLGKVLPTQRAILSEAKSELLLRPKIYNEFRHCIHHVEEVYLALVSLYTAFGPGYTNVMKSLVVAPMQSAVQNLVYPIGKLITKSSALREKKAKGGFCTSCSFTKDSENQTERKHYLMEPLAQVNADFFKIRLQLASHYQLGAVHPEMIRLQGFCFVITEFVRHWENLLDSVLFLRGETIELAPEEMRASLEVVVNDDVAFTDSTGSLKKSSTGISNSPADSPTGSRRTKHSSFLQSHRFSQSGLPRMSPTQEKELSNMKLDRSRIEDECNKVTNSYEGTILNEEET